MHDVILTSEPIARPMRRLAARSALPIITWDTITNLHSTQRLRYRHPVVWLNAGSMTMDDRYHIQAALEHTYWITLWVIFQSWSGWPLEYHLLDRATRVSGVPRVIRQIWQERHGVA